MLAIANVSDYVIHLSGKQSQEDMTTLCREFTAEVPDLGNRNCINKLDEPNRVVLINCLGVI
jgi:hypothetical protein